MKWPQHPPFSAEYHTILAGYMGSIAHGTYIPSNQEGIDDKDVMGIIVPPKRFVMGLEKFEQLATWVDEYDIVLYDIRKFISLLLKNNPNVLGLLWLEHSNYIKQTAWGNALIAHRRLFSSKLAHKSFTGYAYSQLKKMEHLAFEGYMGEKRKALVKQHGFDTKNAAHLIRLLRMGIEFLETEQVNVKRIDAPELISIKRGEVSLEEIKKLAQDLFQKTHDALAKSPLPEQPIALTSGWANNILIDIMEEFWAKRGDD